ncbi:NAD-dependent dihydropyrimidine dehydrogenase PreA subunit [Nitrospirillum amazonense]|uniref:NAD-dependent dihydropyrimidine dehydrogenase PreA subunit n=1 Tax=Nitrospirillum amazonense TaxID=28077 RepID=A0A560FA65_9PROT|nr:ferredoxin family protein [Nitrospirillum amazonense]TWB18484.1 NAD-dependent dihydropyrimidine dehydrogenase PreA subunit [Nitrospirillum amazonense]
MPDNASCKQAPGVIVPRIDRNRCEGKDDCVRVCPYDVFEIGVLPAAERGDLSLGGRVKGFFHGYRQAFAVRADQCRACGLCVSACPEHAITLIRAPAA